MQWTSQQSDAIANVAAWLRIKYQPFFYLGGYAGTGKTVLATHLASLQNGEVRFAAFTGKAARVMRDNGCHGARTIHSLIYSTDVNPDTGEITMMLDPMALVGVSLVIIDEASMVDEALGRDLLSFGVAVLVLGDPGQLPPISGAGFFTAGEPNFMLTDVHRQAKDSPIIRLATAVRERTFRRDPKRVDGLTITSKADLDPADATDADAVIVGRNETRHTYNKRLRELKGFEGDVPVKGETLI
jgi:exodeoxyribonuclease-5